MADDIDLGRPGASARREHARRKANREDRTRSKHPRIGGVLLALRDEPQHERAWAQGAIGEERLAASMAKRLRAEAIVLHDRRIPRSRANIDHIAVAPSGVWVIDAKRYAGKVAVSTPLFGKGKLLVGGRDQSKLIDGLEAQLEVVRSILPAGTPRHGTLCFLDAEMPLLGTLRLRGHAILRPKGLARRVNADGPLKPARIDAIVRELAGALPAA